MKLVNIIPVDYKISSGGKAYEVYFENPREVWSIGGKRTIKFVMKGEDLKVISPRNHELEYLSRKAYNFVTGRFYTPGLATYLLVNTKTGEV